MATNRCWVNTLKDIINENDKERKFVMYDPETKRKISDINAAAEQEISKIKEESELKEAEVKEEAEKRKIDKLNKELAYATRSRFCALVESGFSEEQALKLLIELNRLTDLNFTY